MSAIGITVIENGKIISEYYSLVNPEQRFDYFNVKLTGISSRMVKNEKTFPEIWEEIRETMESGLLTAHNASFDMGVLGKCLRDYGIDWKEEVPYICTCQIGKRHLPDQGHKLDELCSYYNIALNHHHADRKGPALSKGCELPLPEDNPVGSFLRVPGSTNRGPASHRGPAPPDQFRGMAA